VIQEVLVTPAELEELKSQQQNQEESKIDCSIISDIDKISYSDFDESNESTIDFSKI
jgi:hypothetical protein